MGIEARVGARPVGLLSTRGQANLNDARTFYIQIQEGCSMRCSYCAIKTAIGTLRSRTIETVLTDINPVYLHLIFEPVKRLCKQKKISRLYVPTQSASRRLIKLMGRDCDLNAVKQMLIEIKHIAPPGFKMGTSLIAGFPSESTAELEATIRFCQETGFDWVWCHSFSARPETPAAALAGQIPSEEILRRAQEVKSRLGDKALVTTADDTAGNRTCQG